MISYSSCSPEEGLPQVGTSPESEGSAPILPPPEADYDEAEYKWGFADTTGRLAISGRFDEVRPFTKEGLALVRENGRWYFIDPQGQQIGQNWRTAWPYSEGLARVQSDQDSFGFVNTEGQLIIPATYLSAGDFAEGHAWIRTEAGYGLIDNSGQIVIEPQYEKLSDLSNGRLVFKQKEKYGLRNLQKVLIEPQYDRLTDDGDLLRAKQDKRHGYLSPDGRWLIEPAYQIATPFADDRAAVLLNGQWQLIDQSGKNYLKDEYQQVYSAGEGLWIVESNGQYGAIDTNGQLIIPLEYEEIQPFSSGLAVFSQDGLWGYLRPDGSQAFPPEFGLAWPFKDNLARVATRQGFVMIDKSGALKVRPLYRELRDFGEMGLVPVQLYR
ncbi:MAG: WG repeat-containing protein [Bacteroidota bacterium]